VPARVNVADVGNRDGVAVGQASQPLDMPLGRTLLRSLCYGGIVKHLEPEHPAEIPYREPLADTDIARMPAASKP
jgi:hypothetical protein